MSNRTIALGFFLAAFAAFAWLAPQDWNNSQVVTRLGLTLSIVESGRLDIDRFAHRTIDKSLFEGHYYADKVPGLSFLAIPVVAADLLLINRTGGNFDSDNPRDFARLAKRATIAVNGFISALATAMLFLTAIRLGATRAGAVFASTALAFGTPFFGWSTVFFAHSVSGSLLIFAAAAIAFTYAGDSAGGQSRTRLTLFGLGLGMLFGFTLVVDLTAAPACLLGGMLTLGFAAGRRDAAALLRMSSILLVGGVLGLLPLLVYDQLAFGSPFTLGYSKVVGFEGIQQGFFGITWPKPRVATSILFGRFRGLLPLSPVLVLIPVGLYAMWREPSRRVAASAILIVFCSFLWINASYVYWWGGRSLGPRYIMPAVPLCCLALAFAWPRSFRARTLTLVLLAASLILSLICAVAGMLSSDDLNPIVNVFLPAFLSPEKLLKSLPIVVLWILFGLFMFRRPSAETGPTLSALTSSIYELKSTSLSQSPSMTSATSNPK